MTPSAPSDSKMPWRAKALLIVGGVAFLMLVTAIAFFAAWRTKLEKSVEAEVAGIRTNGLPVNMADLEHWPAVIPEENNAALIMRRAFDMVGPTNSKAILELKLPIRGGAISNQADFAAVLAKNAGAMELIYDITNPASSRYPIQYLDGPNTLLPHLAELKTMALLFAAGALLKAETNDSDGAFKDIHASFKLSRSLDNEPLLISQLVSAAIISITTESIERVLAKTPLSDGELSQLQDDLKGAEATNRFWIAMVGERASDGEMIRLMQEDPRAFIIMANKGSSKEDQTDVPIRNPGIVWRSIGFFQRDRKFFLHAMNEYIAAVAKTPPASLSFTNRLEAILAEAHEGRYIMSSMFLPSFSKVVFRDADMRARLKTALAAAAVERWRIAHQGQIPGSLSEVVPGFLEAIPVDPYHGQPLRFKKLAKGYVVYSVGPNGQDDGGKERISTSTKVSPQERNRYDITFIVEH